MLTKKILFVGQLHSWGRSIQRYRAFVRLGYEVTPCTTIPYDFPPDHSGETLKHKFFWKLGIPYDDTGANRKIIQLITADSFHMIWIEKGTIITPHTLRLIRKLQPYSVVISCSEDDMFARHNQTLYYRWGLSLYDIVLTTKVYNLTELKKIGARQTLFFSDAFDPYIHSPRQLTQHERETYKTDVVFIGTFERERANELLFLAQNNIQVNVWGDGWISYAYKHPRLTICGRAIYNDEYAKVLSATKIAICFLRKMNRDQTTSRSVEIPACGAFMLAERTSRHAALFSDGVEAVYFDSSHELLSQITRFLRNSDARIAIAQAGRKRCISSGYDHDTILKDALARIMKISKKDLRV